MWLWNRKPPKQRPNKRLETWLWTFSWSTYCSVKLHPKLSQWLSRRNYWGKSWGTPNYIANELKTGGIRFNGVMTPNVKFLIFQSPSVFTEGVRRKGHRRTIYSNKSHLTLDSGSLDLLNSNGLTLEVPIYMTLTVVHKFQLKAYLFANRAFPNASYV